MTDVPLREDSYRAGRRDGLALGAFALALLAFVNALSLEKAILAAVLAVLALNAAPGGAKSRLALGALTIASLYIVSWVALLIIFWDRISQLIHLLQQLG
jgi:hypothetical protein